MPLVASLTKIATLALALLCVYIKPMSAPVEMAGVAKASHAQCRIYFGCPPSAQLVAGTTSNERSSR
jgi:hypothetical protein